MTNATKTLTIIFSGLLVLTALVKWLGEGSASQAFRSRLVEVDTAGVNRVVIETATQDRVITLKRSQSGWSVASNAADEAYPADDGMVRRSIQQLNDLNVKAVTTRNPEKYTRFKVDSTGTLVSLYRDDTQLAGIYVGAPQIQGRREFNNYVRPADDDAVYTVEGFLGSTFNRDLDGWRDKIVWEIDRDAISRIDFLFPADSSYSIERAGADSWVSAGDTLQTSPVSSITGRLGTLRASGFADSLTVDDFGSELYAIQLQLEDGSQRTLRLKEPRDEATSYLATASEFPYVFTLNRSSFENAVLRPRDELLNE